MDAILGAKTVEWFFGICALFVALGIWANVAEGQRKTDRRQRQLEVNKQRSISRRTFLEQEKAAWPYASGMSGDTNFMMMDAASSQLRFVDGLSGGEGGAVTPLRDRVISVRDVINVELKQDTETVVNVDLKTTTKKDGSLTRAALGGLAFGGAGAVVGAASAGSKGTTKGTHTGTTRIKGNRLVIGTMDPAVPTITQKFASSEGAVAWYHRVLGAVARQTA